MAPSKDPSDGPVQLAGGHLLILEALALLEMERRGVEIPQRRLTEARNYLARRSAEELQEVLDRLGAAQVEKFGGP